MHIAFLRYGGAGLVALLCLASSVEAEEDDISSKDRTYLKRRFANVAVAAEEASLFAVPDLSTPPVWHSPWMEQLPVDRRRVSQAPTGWIPIEGTKGKKAAKDKGAMPDAWVRRRDVVLPSDFKKVRGCWPVKSVVYVGGDYAAEVTFNMDGSARVKEWGDEEWINKQPAHKAHVYMARNIVAISAVKKGGPGFFTSGYRPDERRLYPEGAPADEQELFPEDVLKDCPTVPLLEP